jgi:hypothetical protein
MPFSLFIGLLLMTFPDAPPNASDFHPQADLMLTDFTSSSSNLGWHVVNDNVMGGRSEGSFELQHGELNFSGRTNTNGGGFSSIRTKPLQLDLSDHAGIQLHVKGDGRRYTWRLTSTARWRGRQISYWADFETRNGAWSTVNIPFSDFIPKVITGMGLMIYDNQDGPFKVHLANIYAYAADAPFALMQYHWKKRVLVVPRPQMMKT